MYDNIHLFFMRKKKQIIFLKLFDVFNIILYIKGSAIHPSDDSKVTVEEQPQNQYGFSRQPGQPLSLIPATVLITPEHFKPYRITCPHCQEEITTEISFYMGSAAKSCVFASLFFW